MAERAHGTVIADESLNVFGERLIACSTDPMTGWFRNGSCDTCSQDGGSHTVCAVMTDEFLEYSKAQGNDLITPRPEFGFPGLVAGDCWCLCANRWMEAYSAGKPAKVKLQATHKRALEACPIEALRKCAIDLN